MFMKKNDCPDASFHFERIADDLSAPLEGRAFLWQ